MAYDVLLEEIESVKSLGMHLIKGLLGMVKFIIYVSGSSLVFLYYVI